MDRMKRMDSDIRMLEEERDALRKRIAELEYNARRRKPDLAHKVFKLSPKEEDIICVSGPEVDRQDAESIKQILDNAGLHRCYIYLVPSEVTIKVFDGYHVDMFDALFQGRSLAN